MYLYLILVEIMNVYMFIHLITYLAFSISIHSENTD